MSWEYVVILVISTSAAALGSWLGYLLVEYLKERKRKQAQPILITTGQGGGSGGAVFLRISRTAHGVQFQFSIPIKYMSPFPDRVFVVKELRFGIHGHSIRAERERHRQGTIDKMADLSDFEPYSTHLIRYKTISYTTHPQIDVKDILSVSIDDFRRTFRAEDLQRPLEVEIRLYTFDRENPYVNVVPIQPEVDEHVLNMLRS